MKNIRLILALIILPLTLAQTTVNALEKPIEATESPTWFFYTLGDKIQNLESVDANLPFDQHLQSYLKAYSALNELHQFSNDFGPKLQKLFKNKIPPTGEQMQAVQKLLRAYLVLTHRMLEHASLYGAISEQNASHLIDLKDPVQTKKNLLWFSAHMALLDNFYDGYKSYYISQDLRSMLKDIVKTHEEETKYLFTVIKNTTRKKSQTYLRSYLLQYKNNESALVASAQNDSELNGLVDILSQNQSAKELTKDKLLPIKNYSLVDGIKNIFGKITYGASKYFGNTVGMVRWRHGYLYERPEVLTLLQNNLKPLDIILEKTSFALTDQFIPGNFGHAAIWLGTEQQLKDLGMWNHPSIVPFQKAISEGKSIVQALRPGVGMDTLRRFMKVDQFALIRHKNIDADKKEMGEIYTRALENVGKKYDFRFDVTTQSSLICSELIHYAFGKVLWPTEITVGRHTITPDRLVDLAYYDHSPIEFVLFLVGESNTKFIQAGKSVLAEKIGFIQNLRSQI